MSIVDVERSASAKYKLQVIDCDIHPAMVSWKEIHPYLEKRWIEHLEVYGSHLRHAFSEALSHPRMSPDAARVDAHPEEGGPPGSSLDLMRKQHLDPNGVEIGMLISLRWNPGSQRNLDFGAALTRANEYLAAGALGQAGASAEGFGPGRAGRHRGLRCRNRCPRRRSRFPANPDPAAHRRAVRTASLLADLRSGGAQ